MNAPATAPKTLTRKQRIALFQKVLENAEAVEEALGLTDATLYAALAGRVLASSTVLLVGVYLDPERGLPGTQRDVETKAAKT